MSEQRMDELCKHCGFTYGSHLANGYYSNLYKESYPRNCCPGHEGRMDWSEGKIDYETGEHFSFEGTGTFKERKE